MTVKIQWRLSQLRRVLSWFLLLGTLCFLQNVMEAMVMMGMHQGTLSSDSTGRDGHVHNKQHFTRITQKVGTNQAQNTTSINVVMDKQPNGAFVHIGKTGGSAVSRMLRNGCHSFMPKPCRRIPNETLASKLIQSYYHVPDFQTLPDNHHSFYVLTLRDPFDRTVSAFTYDHPLNDDSYQRNSSLADLNSRFKAYRCFPSLERFVQLLGDNNYYSYPHPPNVVATGNCQTLARAALDSQIRRFQHWFFDYGKIISLLPNDTTGTTTTIYAIRTEHLWKDWESVNRLLGTTTGESSTTSTITNNHHPVHPMEERKVAVTRDLSPMGRQRLCHALEAEYQHYAFLLKVAENLSDGDFQEAVAYSRQRCPNINYFHTPV
ncbi:expressed unknown protein [Seminavis robusta]|uniref:Sulfotransferase domain-containing protein n=1 Tax=Seminavis robusta TaxID=568900 RepID=A0A9N8HQT0_9STRA|nr:expressed unknown protein [Seminavis robusta]|eukprot:Sro1481_g276230.1 n/a (376) ;mRNA; f:13994-15252